MEKDVLFQMLSCDPISFTLSEIEAMMDEELNKELGEMDSELIDLCADILEKEYLKEESGSEDIKKVLKPFKNLPFAATI